MLSKNFRLHKNSDIQRVFQKGARLSVGVGRIHYLFNNKTRRPRLTVVVSNKTAGNATQRNLIKRQVRMLQHQFVQNNPQLPVDIVMVITRPNTFAIMKSEIEQSLNKIKTA